MGSLRVIRDLVEGLNVAVMVSFECHMAEHFRLLEIDGGSFNCTITMRPSFMIYLHHLTVMYVAAHMLYDIFYCFF
jgi:hypothetical protein